ncbi:3 -5 exonuclease domain [Olea europaea subsp. europaea]|uniref:3 -5 exonuclease domain n=1 Tax=Olea europaea subsp. europaea TaxID=158383 RepID=A0A8S0S7C7_OLEEU|nr:3 -5 exonuclease domain [Olea europaea subsp. europaea]
MAGTVYLRTNCFEVKLEGITFKTKDFESLCMMDFLFPDGKIWASPPVVGLNVMPHPRDPLILLMLLCFGVGCVILRFHTGEPLPAKIRKFLTDERIHFVGFGIPEKKDLFPFEELGLTKSKVDVGYLAAKILKDSKYKRWELAELARKVLGIKRMIGLTEASSFERHEQIKCAICQLFITSTIAMGLIAGNDKKKLGDFPKKISFLKNLNSLPSFAEGWFKLPKLKKENHKSKVPDEVDDIRFQIGGEMAYRLDDDIPVNTKCLEVPFGNRHAYAKVQEDVSNDDSFHSKFKEDSSDDDLDNTEGCKGNQLCDCIACAKDKEGMSSDDSGKGKKPIKGILKSPSSVFQRSVSSSSMLQCQTNAGDSLKRANSKGHNVTFKCH